MIELNTLYLVYIHISITDRDEWHKAVFKKQINELRSDTSYMIAFLNEDFSELDPMYYDLNNIKEIKKAPEEEQILWKIKNNL
jgi:hypothetical protein